MPFSRRYLFSRALASLAAIGVLRAAEEPIPAFNSRLPGKPLLATRDPQLYANRPPVQRVYELAGKIRPVLYQMPCYCSCDKFAGHGSLLDCFVDTHGEECAICQREAVYAYRQSKAGVPVRQIRAEIIGGAWRNVDMSPSALAAL